MDKNSKQVWDKIRQKLPIDKSKEATVARNKLFNSFDGNGNGYLSLAEVDKAVRDVLQLDNIFNCKPVIMRAFQAAKSKGNKKSKYSDDYIEKCEFRIFLVYLRQYFEYYEMFDRIDTGDDKKINVYEFTTAVPELAKWGVKVEDPGKSFKEIDTNGGGEILFDEFCHWAIKHSLDLENDDDFEDEELEGMK